MCVIFEIKTLKLFLIITFFTLFQNYTCVLVNNLPNSIEVFVNASIKKLNDEFTIQLNTLMKTHEVFEAKIKNLTNDNLALNSSLLAARKELQDSNEDFKKQLNSQQTTINNLKQISVPIGFIYVQLPNELSPGEIWPGTKWNDVSSTYAGVFFRVTGGDALPFGKVQGDNAPHLERIEALDTLHGVKLYSGFDTSIGNWSEYINTGDWVQTQDYTGIRFKISDGEVRPKNMAVRVWKRVP